MSIPTVLGWLVIAALLALMLLAAFSHRLGRRAEDRLATSLALVLLVASLLLAIWTVAA